MALDPSIILGVKPPEIANPIEVQQKAQQIKNLQLEGQVHQAQVQEMQAQEQDRQLQAAARQRQQAALDARASLSKQFTDPSTGHVDFMAVADGLDKLGFGQDGDSLRKSALDAEKQLAETRAAHQTLLQKQRELIGTLASRAKTYEDFVSGLHILASEPDSNFGEDDARRIEAQVSSAGPDAWKAVAQHFAQFAPENSPEAQAALREKTANASKAEAEAANLTKFGSTTPPSLEQKTVMLDGKPDVLVNYNPRTGVSTLPATGEDVSARIKAMPPAAIQQQNAGIPDVKLSTREEGIAKDLAYGGLTFNQFKSLYPSRSGAGAAIKEAIYGRARELNPAFNPAEFETGFRMYGNPQIRQRLVAIDALGPVIDQIDTLAQQSGNTDVPAFNKLLQAGKFQIGNKTITNFRQLQTLLGDEVGNALGVGTGSDLKTKLGLDLVNPNLSPANFAATMAQLRNVLNARKQTLLGTMGPYGQPGGATSTPPAEKPADLIWDPTTKTFKPGGAK